MVYKDVRCSSSSIWMTGIIGLMGHPLYFYIWGYLFPQPYEGLWLRVVGTILCLALTLKNYWPSSLQQFLPYYWYGLMIYTLPFFFTYMLLKNDLNTVWLMSSVIAVLLTILLANLVGALIVLATGIMLAFFFFRWTDQPIYMRGAEFLQYIPIYLFSVIVGYTFMFFKMAVRDEKFYALLMAIRNMAHELRTPLAGIRGGSLAVANVFPMLRESFQAIHELKSQPPPIGAGHLKALECTLESIQKEVVYSNDIIDILLLSAGSDKISQANFRTTSILECVKDAVQRPGYNNMLTEKIDWSAVTDFKFFGSETLMIHVLCNLIENAYRFIQKSQKGEILLWTTQHKQNNRLHCRDTGPGIPPVVRRRIFDQFFTTESDGDGIGLYFCKVVMTSFQGSIACQSRFGEYTEFILTFPGERSHE